jgi:hypothetical protein
MECVDAAETNGPREARSAERVCELAVCGELGRAVVDVLAVGVEGTLPGSPQERKEDCLRAIQPVRRRTAVVARETGGLLRSMSRACTRQRQFTSTGSALSLPGCAALTNSSYSFSALCRGKSLVYYQRGRTMIASLLSVRQQT